PATVAATVAGRLPPRGASPRTHEASRPSRAQTSRQAQTSPGWRRTLRDVRSAPPLLAGVAVLVVLLAFTSVSWPQARSAAQDARAAGAVAASELEGLTTALDNSQAAHRAEADGLREELATLEGQLAGGSEEVEGLRAQVDAAQADLDEATEDRETL